MSDRRNKREKEQLFNMPEIAKLEKKSVSGAMEKLEDSELKKVLIWVFEIAVTLIFAVLTSMMLFQSVTMQESSMEPTLAVGSRYFVNKLAYKASSPKRGDLIVFRTNASDDAALHIRRVIGLPGETIQIVNGRILINGETYKEGKDFLWASTNRATADMNFVMYSYPYTDKDTFTKDYFIHKRDSVMKANIPGEREGMYMATDSMFVDVEDIVVKGEYAQEARGLWEMEGDMMGGPFVSHARVDRANGRVVVVEAFIYSPDKLKRNLMRQMEASLYTLRLPNESLIDEIVISGNIPEEKIDTTSRVK